MAVSRTPQLGRPSPKHPTSPAQPVSVGAVSTARALLLKDGGPSLGPPRFFLPSVCLHTRCRHLSCAGKRVLQEQKKRAAAGRTDRGTACSLRLQLPDGQTDRLGTPSSVHLLKLPATSEPQRRPRLPEIPRDSHEQARRLKNCPTSVKGSASGEKTTPGTPALSAASNTFWALLFPFPLYCAN